MSIRHWILNCIITLPKNAHKIKTLYLKYVVTLAAWIIPRILAKLRACYCLRLKIRFDSNFEIRFEKINWKVGKEI